MLNQSLRSQIGNAEQNGTTERTSSRNVFRPDVDIIETANAIYLVADMPGVDDASAEVGLENNVLTIRGSVSAAEPEGYTPAYAEFEPGDFERSFTVSDVIDRNRIEATVKNGVLRLTLPKAEEKLARKIAVNAG